MERLNFYKTNDDWNLVGVRIAKSEVLWIDIEKLKSFLNDSEQHMKGFEILADEDDDTLEDLF